jgi:two-component system, NarL family, sensor kinase
VVSRFLAVLSILISTFLMIRYMRYREYTQAQENYLATERELAQTRDDFMAALTHDLKTPLLGGRHALQHLLEESLGPISQEQKELVETLLRSNRRQLDLVEALVSVYRNDNVGVKLTMSWVDMDDLIADIMLELRHFADEQRVELQYYCAKTPSPIKADALQLKRVIANLLQNALNHSPAGSNVQISLSEDSNQLRVDILDMGPGLSAEDLRNLFQRFYQADGLRHIVSTGLGLYLSRQIILAHQGHIWAENQPAGGCRFSFTLPANLKPNDHLPFMQTGQPVSIHENKESLS